MKNYFRFSFIVITLLLSIFITGCGTSSGSGGHTPVTTELYYDNTNDASIARFGAEATQESCVIFDTVKLSSYVGGQIIAVKLFNPDTISHDYTAQVFEADAGVNPPTLVSINSTATTINSKSWQTITLDTPVTIQATKVYWAGYKILGATGFPLAVGGESDYGNNKERTSGDSGVFRDVVPNNWIVKILVRK